jgi:glycosyltransferase involved in cell wall biosynthesis
VTSSIAPAEQVSGGRETLWVIIPCLNEAEGVVETVGDVLRHAPTLPVDVRVLMVDDGSTDGTRDRMAELCAAHPECSMLVNPRNLGTGRSVLRAYDSIPDGSWVVGIPGDNELVFASIDNHLAIRGDYDLVVGYLQNAVIRTIPRRLASWAFTQTVNTLYGFPWRYLNGMKLYRVEVFRGLEIVSGGHAFMAELVAKAQLRRPALRIGEAPFVARGRARGSSKAVRPGSVVRALWDVWRGARSVARFREQVVRGRE